VLGRREPRARDPVGVSDFIGADRDPRNRKLRYYHRARRIEGSAGTVERDEGRLVYGKCGRWPGGKQGRERWVARRADGDEEERSGAAGPNELAADQASRLSVHRPHLRPVLQQPGSNDVSRGPVGIVTIRYPADLQRHYRLAHPRSRLQPSGHRPMGRNGISADFYGELTGAYAGRKLTV
jgi:hypothetical protein